MPRVTQNTDTAEVRSIVAGAGTKSEKARQLAALSIPVSQIARLLGMSRGHAQQAVGSRNYVAKRQSENEKTKKTFFGARDAYYNIGDSLHSAKKVFAQDPKTKEIISNMLKLQSKLLDYLNSHYIWD